MTRTTQNRLPDLTRFQLLANNRIDATNEIVRYVESEKTMEERRRSASAVKRAKWWLFGMDDDG